MSTSKKVARSAQWRGARGTATTLAVWTYDGAGTYTLEATGTNAAGFVTSGSTIEFTVGASRSGVRRIGTGFFQVTG